MRCPFCGYVETQVKDSRPAEEGAAIRRRRSCPSCAARFTSYERIQLRDILVKKSTGEVELFSREKLIRSMMIALRKRPIDEEKLDLMVNSIIRQLEMAGDVDVTTSMIGKKAMDALYTLDKVAYVRYASVYRDFRDTDDFTGFVKDLERRMKDEKKQPEPPTPKEKSKTKAKK